PESSVMTTTDQPRHLSPAPLHWPEPRPGPLGRLGVGVIDHARLTSVVWLLDQPEAWRPPAHATRSMSTRTR
ncbi:MAG: hypothetical protein ABIZ34_10715, partial [Candidatus Limnocylindrales bacterium]